MCATGRVSRLNRLLTAALFPDNVKREIQFKCRKGIMNNERHRRSPRFDTARRKWKSSQEYRIVCWSYMDVKRQMPYLLPTHFPWYIQYTICTRWCELWANNVQNLPIYIVVEWRWRCCWGLGVVYVDILGSLIRHQSVSLCLIWSFLSRINMIEYISIQFLHFILPLFSSNSVDYWLKHESMWMCT